MESVVKSYERFFMISWRMDDKEYLKLCDSLNKSDAEEFLIDLRKVNQVMDGRRYQHGLAKYYMLEDIPALNSGYRQIV